MKIYSNKKSLPDLNDLAGINFLQAFLNDGAHAHPGRVRGHATTHLP